MERCIHLSKMYEIMVINFEENDPFPLKIIYTQQKKLKKKKRQMEIGFFRIGKMLTDENEEKC